MEAPNQPNTISLLPGEFLIREKTPAEALYIIKEGQLEVYKTGGDGERIPLAIISSGQYVGETAILLGTQNSSNVIALSPVKAVKLSKAAIDTQLKAVPSWLISLTKGLVERLHTANDLLRRNGWVDEALQTKLKAVEDKYKSELYLKKKD